MIGVMNIQRPRGNISYEGMSSSSGNMRVGAVRLLESTAELAKVVVSASGDEFWVKWVDLTQVCIVMEKSKPAKKQLGENPPNASPNSRYHKVRVA